MKANKNAAAYGVLMLILGMCPLLISTILSAATGSELAEIISLPLCYLLGGTICLLFATKGLKADTKRYFKRPDCLTLSLAALAGMGWSLADAYISNSKAIHNAVGANITGTDKYEMLTTIIIAPVAEELIFRFGMLTMFLIAAGKSRSKAALGVVFTTLAWLFPHFPKNYVRMVDIIIVGILISLIYIASKNIFYCIAFHVGANLITMTCCAFAGSFVSHGIFMYIGIAVFAVSAPLMFARLLHQGREVRFQSADTLKAV